MKPKTDQIFWPSYSDFMTSLFLVMLVLFVLSYAQFMRIEGDLLVQINESTKIKEIEEAVKRFDTKAIYYNSRLKRYELLQKTHFAASGWSITDSVDRDSLLSIGRYLQNLFQNTKKEEGDSLKYLLLIEGRASRDENLYSGSSQERNGLWLSYQRARSLQRLWEAAGIIFEPTVCELVIGGNGVDGQGRYQEEVKNRSLVIHIIPKVGRIE